MDLFLIRHAIAEERRAGLPDTQRALTDKGRTRFEAMVQRLDHDGFHFDRVYYSPWLRASQTADLLAPVTSGPMIPTEALAQSPRPNFFASLEGQKVACVGHEPWLSDTVALLTTGTPNGTWLKLKKGSVTWLRGAPTPASMQLRALWGHSPPPVTPRNH